MHVPTHFFSITDTYAHTYTARVCLRGEEQQYFSTASVSALCNLCFTRPVWSCCSKRFPHLPFCCGTMCVCVCERECVCLHVCVYLWSQVKPFPPIDVILSAWHAQTNSFIVWIQKWSLNSPHSSIKWMRVFIHMWIHEDFFYDHKPEQQVFVIIYKLNMYRLDFTRVSFISSTTQVGNAVACWSLLVTFYATADVCVLVRFGCESLSVNMCALDHNSYFLTIVPL